MNEEHKPNYIRKSLRNLNILVMGVFVAANAIKYISPNYNDSPVDSQNSIHHEEINSSSTINGSLDHIVDEEPLRRSREESFQGYPITTGSDHEMLPDSSRRSINGHSKVQSNPCFKKEDIINYKHEKQDQSTHINYFEPQSLDLIDDSPLISDSYLIYGGCLNKNINDKKSFDINYLKRKLFIVR